MTYGHPQPRYSYPQAVELVEQSLSAQCGKRGLKFFHVYKSHYDDSLGRFVLLCVSQCCNSIEFWARYEVSPMAGVVDQRALTPDEVARLASEMLGKKPSP